MEKALQSLVGLEIDGIEAVPGPPDRVSFTLGKTRLTLPIDDLVPVGEAEWDEWWPDFDDFVEEPEEDVEPLDADDCITLGELLGARIERVRTGRSPKGAPFVMLDLDAGLSLLMPLAPLGKWSGFDALLDPEVSAGIQDV